MVPPPPTSTLPSSEVCQSTPPSSIIARICAIYSALASLEPPLPPRPVNLLKHTPWPISAAFFFSNTPAKLGSKPALTSLESMRLFCSARFTPRAQ